MRETGREHFLSALFWIGSNKKIEAIRTLDSGIDITPGKNIATGTFGKNNKRSP